MINFASLNFTMDLLLILVALGFLIRDYPVRSACLTVLCILSYVLPITRLENALSASAQHKIASTAAPAPTATTPLTPTTETSDDLHNPDTPTSEATAPVTPETTADAVREQVQKMSKADPTQVNGNITGIWNTVLNGLNNTPGANNAPPTNIDQALTQKTGQALAGLIAPSLTSTAGVTHRFEWTTLQKTLTEGRFGNSVLRAREVAIVDAFWFISRCCLLTGSAYFLLSDWKVTMSIVSFCLIPLHYYLVLLICLARNWEKTKPWWGAIQASAIGLVALLLVAIIVRQIMSMVGRRHYVIPNPEQYRARMGGTEYDYVILGNAIELAGISLDLGLSYFDKKNPKILRFQSGAAIEFIARAKKTKPPTSI